MEHDTQKFIDLKERIIKRQKALNNLNLPKNNFTKKELRTGIMGRAQRKERVRFVKKVKAQKTDLAIQKSKIERYLKRVDSIPAPKITISNIPKLRRIRGRFRKQIKRRKR